MRLRKPVHLRVLTKHCAYYRRERTGRRQNEKRVGKLDRSGTYLFTAPELDCIERDSIGLRSPGLPTASHWKRHHTALRAAITSAGGTRATPTPRCELIMLAKPATVGSSKNRRNGSSTWNRL